jgi:tetratricopeptide (TPR) repeat protein
LTIGYANHEYNEGGGAMSDRSAHARDISQSVVVTGDGNTVSLTFGDSGIVLPLRRRQFPPPDRRRRPTPSDPPRELNLLVPAAGRLPLIGRKDIFAELQAWIDDDAAISIHALIGRAGSGKTRLALEFCSKVDSDANADGGWLAGFLSPSDLAPVVDTLATRHFVWERPTLLVIDYAAQCHEALGGWLDRLAGQKLDTKLRILLLDREAPEDFGWWRELTDSGLNTARERRGLFYADRPRQLPDLSDLEERRDLMQAALQGARDLRSVPSGGPQIPPKGENSDFDAILAKPQFGNALNLVMAGVIALDRGPQGALALRRLDVARHLARRELRRLEELARSRQVGDEMRHTIAFNGLAGGIPLAQLRKTVADELLISHRSTDQLSALLTLLQQELPARTNAAQQPRLATLQPDLIGEAAIIEAFTGEPSREAEAVEVVRRAYQLSREPAAHALVRLVQDFAHAVEDPNATDGERTTGRRIMSWILDLLQEIEDLEQLVPFANALPEQTTILRELSAELTQRLATYFVREAERSNDPVARITAANWLNQLAIRLSYLGRREEALAAAEEAVLLRRLLAEERPDAFTPDLARSLNNLANMLGDLGRHEDALMVAEEALRLRRALVEARPNTFTPDLATSLHNFATTLGALGRREEALSAAEEAVRLRRVLMDASPDSFTPYLAGSLTNLSVRLNALGRREEAMTAADDAVRLYRTLAEARPDAFAPHLAGALINLANRLAAIGRYEEALTAAEEGIRRCRGLAKDQPDAFTPDLAMSLNNIASIQCALGRHGEALTAAEEAVCLRRTLADARPGKFESDLANSLVNLAAALSAVGERKRALTVAEQAVGIYRALADSRPDAFNPDLAMSLNTIAAASRALGRRHKALSAAEEAVRLYRTLAESRSDVFAVELARSLWVLGDLYGETGNFDPAIAILAEGLRLLTPIFAAFPAAMAGQMGGLVQSYLSQCETAGREPDEELLGPAIAAFERLKATEDEK